MSPVLELVTLEMLVSNLIGGALGLGVAWILYRKASKEAERQFTTLARFLEQFARAALPDRGVTLDFARDKRGRIRNARINIPFGTARAKIPYGSEGGGEPEADPQ